MAGYTRSRYKPAARETRQTKADKERIEQAWRAVKAFNELLPTLNSFARAITGNPKIRVQSTESNSRTDGKVIWIQPAFEFGDVREHDRHLCEKRDSETLMKYCKACAAREMLMRRVFHEISHIAFKSTAPVNGSIRSAVSELIDEWHPADACGHAGPLKREIQGAEGHQHLAAIFSPFLKSILMSYEDARVDARMYEARPGLRIPTEAGHIHAFSNGVRFGDGTHSLWRDAKPNMQLLVGLLLLAAGHEIRDGYFAPEVKEQLSDPLLQSISQRALHAGDVSDSLRIAIEGFRRLQELGLCVVPKCVPVPSLEAEPDDKPEDKEDDSEPQPNSGDDGPASDDREADATDGEPGQDASPEDPKTAEESDGQDDADDSGDPDDPGGADDPGGTSDPGDPNGADDCDGGDGDGSSDSDRDSTDDSDQGTDGDADSDPGSGDGGSESGDSGDKESPGPDVPPDASPDPDGSSGGGDGGNQEGASADDEPEGSELPPSSDVTESTADDDESGSDDDGGSDGHGSGSDPGEQEAGDVDGEPETEGEGDPEPVSGESEGDGEPGDADDSSSQGDGDGSDGDAESASQGDLPGGGDPASDVNADADPVSESELEDDDAGSDADLDEAEGDGSDEPSEAEARQVIGEDVWTEDNPESIAVEPGQEVLGNPFDGLTEEEMGTPEELLDALDKFLGHGHEEELDAEMLKEALDDMYVRTDNHAAVTVALSQQSAFDTSSRKVRGLKVIQYPNPSLRWPARYFYEDQRPKPSEFMPSEAVIGGSLMKARIVFADNKRAKHQRDLKSGRVNAKVLGRRAATGDDRLFQRKIIPGKRDYYVVIGIDCSGSTASGHRMERIKRAVFAKAELLNRLGIPFAVYGHTGGESNVEVDAFDYDYLMDDGMTEVWMLEIKGAKDPWNETTRQRLADLNPCLENLDGHTLEFYRKVALKSRATDRIIMYYTDGAMPAANHDEELEVLVAQIEQCKREKITLMAVGINTDSPLRYGFDTVRVDSDEDLSKVVAHLGGRLIT